MGRPSGGAPWITKIAVGPVDSCECSRAPFQMRGSRAARSCRMHTAFTERTQPRYGAGRRRKHTSVRDGAGAPCKRMRNISKRRWLRQ